MPVDHIRYDILVQDALRGMVRNVLTDAAKNGLIGDHHFFITFDTTAEGVRLSDRLRAQYPEEMTVVLQHQFWDLKVTDEAFEVGLSFGGVAERLHVPFDAIKAFADPSVQFTLQFETLTEGGAGGGSTSQSLEAENRRTRRRSRLQGKRPAFSKQPSGPACRQARFRLSPPRSEDNRPDRRSRANPVTSGGAEVVRLDRFRKK